MNVYMCVVCGWLYYEAAGMPEHGIAPGTRWEDVPDDWRCPECKILKVKKGVFKKYVEGT